MQRILGLVGGMSWHSTVDYYRLINEGVNQRLGGFESARLILHSLAFEEIKRNNDANDWDATLKIVVEACLHMKQGGAQAIVLCANTIHLIADRVEHAVGLPVIHIARAVADAARQKRIGKVALLGTKFTMEKDFFKEKLRAAGVEVIVPSEADRTFIHASIFDELVHGTLRPETKERYLRIIGELQKQGAEGAVLGCTEIPLLIKQEDLAIPCFDTTVLHARAAVDFALS